MEINEDDEEELGFSRNYFLAKELGGGSTKKSTRKISDIDVVDEQELRAAVANIEPKHEREIESLLNGYKSSYSKWVFDLRCGFGLLMYGFGSKKGLIEDFVSTALTKYSVVVINGYLQYVNIKQVMTALAEVWWEQLKSKRRTPSKILPKVQQPFSSKSIEDLLAFLDCPHENGSDSFVCVVVHNIDGPGLRDSDSQQYLARMASCSNIRIVASIDHVNAPLLWDKQIVHSQFNWCWYHVPTFAPYKVEGILYPLILAHGGTAPSAKAAALVLHSLTPNARSVFKILIEYKLSHPDEEGMPVDNLYSTSRERFLVSSQVTLNSHLTEFKDHELVKIKRNSDGQDCLYVPLATDSLQKLLQEINQ
ncbi:hypothetical protein K2173_001300 [Erythroxylum novogranatense]|uniref:Origin recognition complex subunit 2 n=1 Tax=Erythroxylum novogranatense TaxID=1862640 RepID=A0AAV8T4K6_9ROSI|nr:hypothetical protein K2173_001300 [Erythroxylum novogranatense]